MNAIRCFDVDMDGDGWRWSGWTELDHVVIIREGRRRGKSFKLITRTPG